MSDTPSSTQAKPISKEEQAWPEKRLELVEARKRWDAFVATPIGTAFQRFENAHADAWRKDAKFEYTDMGEKAQKSHGKNAMLHERNSCPSFANSRPYLTFSNNFRERILMKLIELALHDEDAIALRDALEVAIYSREIEAVEPGLLNSERREQTRKAQDYRNLLHRLERAQELAS